MKNIFCLFNIHNWEKWDNGEAKFCLECGKFIDNRKDITIIRDQTFENMTIYDMKELEYEVWLREVK
jgi:hypothetical protein